MGKWAVFSHYVVQLKSWWGFNVNRAQAQVWQSSTLQVLSDYCVLDSKSWQREHGWVWMLYAGHSQRNSFLPFFFKRAIKKSLSAALNRKISPNNPHDEHRKRSGKGRQSHACSGVYIMGRCKIVPLTREVLGKRLHLMDAKNCLQPWPLWKMSDLWLQKKRFVWAFWHAETEGWTKSRLTVPICEKSDEVMAKTPDTK